MIRHKIKSINHDISTGNEEPHSDSHNWRAAAFSTTSAETVWTISDEPNWNDDVEYERIMTNCD